jgi:MFS family permease
MIIFVLGGGLLGDFFGRRRIWLAGLGSMIFFFLLLMVIRDPFWHLIVRFGMIASGSLVAPLALATLNISFTDRIRGIAIAIYTSLNAGAIQLAWVQGQFMNNWLGPGAAYLIPLLITILALICTVRYAPESRSGRARLLDTLIYSGWTLLILGGLYGVMVLPVVTEQWLLVAAATLAVALTGTVLLVWRYWRTSHAMLDGRPFLARDVTTLIVTGAVINFVLIGFGVRTFGLFQVVMSMSPIVAFIAFAPMLIGTLSAVYLFLKIMGHYRARIVIAAGMLLIAVALAAAALAPGDGPYWFYVLPLIVFGSGFVVTTTVWMGAFLRTAVHGHFGLNAAITSATALIGGALGSVITGNMLSALGIEFFHAGVAAANIDPARLNQAMQDFTYIAVAEPTDIAAVMGYVNNSLMSLYREAYSAAYDQILWVMVVLCILTALLIVFGLRRNLDASLVAPTEARIEHDGPLPAKAE